MHEYRLLFGTLFKKKNYSGAALWDTFIENISYNYKKKISDNYKKNYVLAAVWDTFVKTFSDNYKKNLFGTIQKFSSQP